jgi:hypothetical protein
MLANIVAGVNKSIELNNKTEYVMVVSADIPALKPEMVDWLAVTCMNTRDDLYYGVCTSEVMEKRFPGSKRTYTKIKDMELCGADINITHVGMATEHLDLWESLIGSRKNPLKQASMIGLGLLWQVFTRSITLDELVAKISLRIGIKGRAIIWPYAEACMDVDKPHQFELLRLDLAKPHQGEFLHKDLAKQKKKRTSANSKTGQIFISYRRADSAGYAGRIYDRLAAHFKEDALFMDVDTIDAGLDFVDVLENAVQSCDVLVALIAKQWLNIKDETGKRRLDNPQDFVRIEVAAALSRGIRVIPVLFDGTPIPNSGQLPSNLKPLARRNAVLVNHYSFHADATRLIEQLERALKVAEKSKILKAK